MIRGKKIVLSSLLIQSLAAAFPIFISLFLLNSTALGQWYDPTKINKKAIEKLDQSFDPIPKGEFEKAMNLINEAIKLDRRYVDAWISKAALFQRMKKYDSSAQYFVHAIQMDTIYAKEQYLPYAISLAGMTKFNEALHAIDKYLSIPNLNERSRQSAWILQSQYGFAVQYDSLYLQNIHTELPFALSNKINSVHMEYYPSIPTDGKTILFNRRDASGDEDFYEANYTDTGWTMARPVRGKINTYQNEGAGTISQDGNYIIYTGCHYPDGLGSCDLQIAEKQRNGLWGAGKNMGPLINSEFWDSSPCLSPDNQTLYFSSNRPGGFGGKDIWISHRLPSGKWSRPKNAGSTINTNLDESCPFMHADNKHLYFSSNGHQGYGNTDVFVSELTDDTTWTTPFNLGYPINTPEEESSLIVMAGGDTALFTSDRNHLGQGLDIYAIRLRDDIRPPRTIGLHGRVIDAINQQPIACKIEMADLNSLRKYKDIRSDADGRFFATLSKGEDYLCTIECKDYLFFTQRFKVSDTAKDQTLQIALQPIKNDAKIILKNIFFDRNSFSLANTPQAELEKLIQLLKVKPNLEITIVGHTDNTGTTAYNLTLSQKRAEAIKNYLLQKGIEGRRMKTEGKGDTEPLEKNTTEEGKNNNRRTEIHVTRF